VWIFSHREKKGRRGKGKGREGGGKVEERERDNEDGE